jgi:hypothetical protein
MQKPDRPWGNLTDELDHTLSERTIFGRVGFASADPSIRPLAETPRARSS